MTQVANLNTGMNVPVRTNAASKQERSQDLLSEFAGIMNQNAQSYLNTSADYGTGSDGLSEDRVSLSDTKDTVKKDYEKFGSSGNRKITQAKPDRTDQEAFSEKVQGLADDVKETVQETMQVSEEEIEAAMERLGLGVFDLLEPQHLIELVQELSGAADVSALLTDGNFQMTLQQATGLITDFQQENGLNNVQFSDLLEQLSAQIDELEETVKELLNVDEVSQPMQMTDVQTGGLAEEDLADLGLPVEHVQTTSETTENVEQQNPAVQTTLEESQNAADEVTEQPVTMAAEERIGGSAQGTEQEGNPTSQEGKNKQQFFANTSDQEHTITEQHAGIFRENTVMANDQNAAVQPETSQMQTYIELEHLMDQMEGLARTFASTEGTTVEMQLNPENLGRLVLTVTEKNGNVTAQIAASNEQVKEALQTQMVELRATLQTQGIKVEAVEVTVATHEFEQNLDGNTSANGQMQEQANRQGAGAQNGRRNLNMNSLDELSGLMSEEETLVAQMMRDNGGTVDFTA